MRVITMHACSRMHTQCAECILKSSHEAPRPSRRVPFQGHIEMDTPRFAILLLDADGQWLDDPLGLITSCVGAAQPLALLQASSPNCKKPARLANGAESN
eukprot:CAMPEP_0177570862 /NCGR_PEP_ID=MMETSP0369-20130122/77096_1 /TAXON_ID=447022 ORGANISM="Scrippsiella hangoei-like, Strain SHHI-4" /NCGR_SAMPLE_ID=MMETSP0369 /ASSEMBLY_ACC=CAM_ASM_000364 /LENGTH=99 /DNA_ID=CAMNT_0019058687 /DNA_START=31 /DNA_END=328 /DNA_ORIENTATION=+